MQWHSYLFINTTVDKHATCRVKSVQGSYIALLHFIHALLYYSPVVPFIFCAFALIYMFISVAAYTFDICK